MPHVEGTLRLSVSVVVSLVRSQMRHLCRCAVMRFVSGLSVWVNSEQFGKVNEQQRKPQGHTPEDGTDRSSRNVGKKLPLLAA
jgi:hypothetical protein